MPHIPINGAEIFYETFGRSCWMNVVTRLGRDFFVILPDCRGYGQSSNPQLTYSFKGHACDMAARVLMRPPKE